MTPGDRFRIRGLHDNLNGALVEFHNTETDEDGNEDHTFRFLEDRRPYKKGEFICLEKYHVEGADLAYNG